MSNRVESTVPFFLDCMSVNIAYALYLMLRVRSGWLDVSMEPGFRFPMLLIGSYWLVVFFMVGLYRTWYAAPHFNELALVFKTLTLGCAFLFSS